MSVMAKTLILEETTPKCGQKVFKSPGKKLSIGYSGDSASSALCPGKLPMQNLKVLPPSYPG